MMKRTILSLLTLGVICHWMALPSWSQDTFKIGVIDTQQVLEEYERAKLGMEKLDRERDRLRDRGQQLVDELRGMQETLSKKRKFLDEEQVTQTENDIRIKQTEIESFTTTAQDTLDDMQQELFDPILEEIEEYILNLGKQENFTMLLRKQLVVLYVKPEFDLTERVIRELNERYTQSQQTSQGSTQEATQPAEQKPEK